MGFGLVLKSILSHLKVIYASDSHFKTLIVIFSQVLLEINDC